jgi:hypothetical protein
MDNVISLFDWAKQKQKKEAELGIEHLIEKNRKKSLKQAEQRRHNNAQVIKNAKNKKTV